LHLAWTNEFQLEERRTMERLTEPLQLRKTECCWTCQPPQLLCLHWLSKTKASQSNVVAGLYAIQTHSIVMEIGVAVFRTSNSINKRWRNNEGL